MRTNTFIIIILLSFTSCKFDNRDGMDRLLDNTRENLKQEGKKFNAENQEWESLIDNIYKLSTENQLLAYEKIDRIILDNPELDEFKIQELYFIKGDIYYVNDSLNKAIDEFTKSGINFPKSLAARAAALLKLNRKEEALQDLVKAAEINNDYYWDIGNYYEVIRKRDSAIFYYDKLYSTNQDFYKYCNDRIQDLKNPKTKLYSRLIYRNRKRITIKMAE